jgi:hypothetical protein
MTSRINTAMTDPRTLADNLLANFRTIRISAEALPSYGKPPPAGWLANAKANRADKRVVYDCRDEVRHALKQRGHKFFTCLEADPEGGWRVHVFVLCETAATLVDEIGGENCGVGDPVNFDPEEFINNRLGELGLFDQR